jgi:hypothetical protein
VNQKLPHRRLDSGHPCPSLDHTSSALRIENWRNYQYLILKHSDPQLITRSVAGQCANGLGKARAQLCVAAAARTKLSTECATPVRARNLKLSEKGAIGFAHSIPIQTHATSFINASRYLDLK